MLSVFEILPVQLKPTRKNNRPQLVVSCSTSQHKERSTSSVLTQQLIHTPALKQLGTTHFNFDETQGQCEELQKELSKDFLKLLVANGSPWLVANNPETHIFSNIVDDTWHNHSQS
jgi:hypothetical protein